MYQDIKENIRGILRNAVGEVIKPEELHESELCDLTSTVAFRLAGGLEKNPKELAEEIVDRIKTAKIGVDKGGEPPYLAEEITGRIEPCKFIRKVEAVNGHINIFLNYSEIILPTIREIRVMGDGYGRGKPREEKIVLEHTSINPSGPVHVGRLRNSLIGDSLVRILRFYGYKVETHYYVNDIGKQIAIIALGMKEGIKPDGDAAKNYMGYKDKEDFKILFHYISANREFESNPEFARRVQEFIKDAEEGNPTALDEISSVARRCLDGQRKIFHSMGIEFDFFDFESDWLREGKIKPVLEFLKKSRYFKTTDAGSGLDLSKFGLEREGGVSILTRSDGTSVYLLRDITYHLDKAKRGDLMINVLGEDHKFEFREIKTILQKFYHLPTLIEAVHYSFVNFEGDSLSTRKGQIAPVDRLIDEALDKAAKEIEKRKIAGKEVAPAIGLGAIKYHILKTSPHKPINFSWKRALDFDGDTAPYIQYAHARCCSILRKSDINLDSIDNFDKNLDKEEEELLFNLIKFPGVVENSALERKPNLTANYLYALAHSLNRFYRKCPVLPAEQGVKERRLLLVDATRQVLKNALNLLGIDAPERM